MSSSQVLIRDIEQGVFEQLKERAKQNGRSFEAELRLILKEAAEKEEKVISMLALSRKVRLCLKVKLFSIAGI